LAALSDDALMSLVADRDGAAFAVLSRRLSVQGLALAGSLLSRRTADGEDVVQEALLRLWRMAPDWRPDHGARVSTWFYRVVYNLCIDRLRRAPQEDVSSLVDLPDPGEPAPARLARDEETRQVRAAVADLPERQRDAVILCYFQDCTRSQAAAVLGSTPDAVESLLARARRTLRQRIRDLRGEGA
jgi:RNA polymerase sigma-70 factor (ECF subfamily)